MEMRLSFLIYLSPIEFHSLEGYLFT